jgi:hypothetical protein
MNANESRVAMARDNAVQCFNQMQAGRELVGIAEPPAAMVFEFLPTFVLVVEWQPERLRIPDMDGHGHP